MRESAENHFHRLCSSYILNLMEKETSFASLILGNRLDLLAAILAKVLDEEASDPFAPRIILLPSSEMKSWLLMQLAHFSSKKAIAGLKVFSWQEGMRYLLNQPGLEPSYLELYLSIYEALCSSQEAALQEYVKARGLVDLTSELASLFGAYGFYGKELLQMSEDHWQVCLWKQLFVSGPWKAPMQLLSQPLQPVGRVYCFGCNHLPQVVWKALLQIEEIKIFHFSPTTVYWDDLCSDRERRGILKYGKFRNVSEGELEQMSDYLFDAHPLLANWGKAGRSALKLFNEYDLDIQEVYDERQEKNCQLTALQKDLLFHTKSSFSSLDGSIKIHKTGSSRLREIQVLKSEMLRARLQGISFSEMLVLASDLNVYVPFIECVFSEEDCPIAYQLIGIHESAQQSAFQGFKKLLALSQSRWEADDLLLVLENQAFRAKRGWDTARLDQLRKWILDSRISWGLNAEHKKERLAQWLEPKEIRADQRGTWREGMDRLVASLVYLFSEESAKEPFLGLVSGIGLGSADELEEFLQLLEQLQQDLSMLVDGSIQTLNKWADDLRSLYETYFPSEESGAFEEVCYALRKAGERISSAVPFSALLHLFDKVSNISLGSSLLHAARFSSLEEGAVIPSRALFLIGFDEESFPRRPSSSSLNLCKAFQEQPPFPSELDRYLFLQAVCSAQDLLVISYGHISAEDGKEVNPSIVVQELERYVNKIEVTTHPSFPLATRCFEEPSCRPMCQKEYEMARLFYAPKQPLAFFDSFRSPKLSEALPSELQSISLKELNNFFRNPWKYYLQKTFQLWIEEAKKDDWLDFELTPQKRAYLLKGGLYQSLDKLIDRSEKKREFPVGLFGQIASSEVAQIHVEWKQHLHGWGLQEELISEKLPVKVDLEGLKIVGTLKHCSSRGPLHVGEDSFTSLLKNWPEYLVALCSLGAHEIFCVRSGDIKTISSPREELKKCIELYNRGVQTPLPLISQWADALVRRNSAVELEKAFSPGLRTWKDPVYEWVAARAGPFSAGSLVDEWGSYLQKQLQALVDLYPMRSKE